MFQVFDCGKPADCLHCNVHKSWSKSIYETFDEAKEYAYKWLGAFSVSVGSNWDGRPVDYDGYGDMIEIRNV
jgi:hypothetical protein